MAVDDKGSTSQAASEVFGTEFSLSQSQAPPAPPVEADALLTISSDAASSSMPAAMAETEEDKVREFSALTGIIDRDRCAQILAGSDWDLDLAVAFVAADPSSPDAAPSAPLETNLVAPATAADAHHSGGVVWKMVTLPFRIIGGGMDLLLGTVGLGIWAVGRGLSLLGLARTDHWLIKGVSDTDHTGEKAKFLPQDVLLEIACRLRVSRRDVQSMRSVCSQWRAVIPNTNGPWLVLSHRRQVLPPGTQRIVVLQMLAAAADVTMAAVPCLSSPPLSASCWGAAHGLIALTQSGTNDLYLFCLIYGCSRILPSLSDEMTPHGIFFNEHPLEPLATISITTNCTDVSSICYPSRLHQEPTGLQDAQRLRWAMYPGTEKHIMRSVCFSDCVHFIGATLGNMVVIDELGSPLGQDMAVVDVPVALDGQMVVWGKYGHHVFQCSDNIYICLLLRDYEDANIVSAQVFLLQSSAGYHLMPTNDIGSYAVYLGANKPVVLPAEDGSLVQWRNTIYVTDDDGNAATGRVLSIDLSSHEIMFIPFPEDVSMNDYGHASWVAPPPLDSPIWHMWHCNN